MNIVHEINRLARRVNSKAKVMNFTLLEADKDGLNAFLDELKESIRVGNWIIVENCHLVNNWPSEILQLLFVSLIEVCLSIFFIRIFEIFFFYRK